MLFSKSNKKGGKEVTAAASAALIGVIGLAIIIYIILIPPELRQELLDEGEIPGFPLVGEVRPSTLTPAEKVNLTLVSENIGEVKYVKQDEVEHLIPTINLYTRTDGQIIKEVRTIYAKNTLFTREPETLTFQIADLANTKNVKLNFLVPYSEGRLVIKLNDFEVYNNEITTTNIEPIPLSKEYLRDNNVIEFSVSNPGFLFWKVNEYTLESMTITADITDVSKRESETKFYVESDEKQNVEKAKLNYYPDCTVGQVGKLNILLNDNNLYSGIPDCNYVNTVDFPKEYLQSGFNAIKFFAESGTYYIHDIKLTSELKEAKNYIYYFNLDEDFFNKLGSTEPRCGDVDDICPDDCDADLDKDCCFEESEDNYWCDISPSEVDDRCVSYVSAAKCDDCRAGYEDKDGDIAQKCEGLCGDDNDDKCPIGCSKFYDQDCCDTYEYYWCDDTPETGVEGICVAGVTQESCKYCAEGYQNKNGDPSCPVEKEELDKYKLKSKYNVEFEIKFVDDREEKEAEVLVNNNKFLISTKDDSYKREIDLSVRPDYNAIKLVPLSNLNIVSLTVKIKED